MKKEGHMQCISSHGHWVWGRWEGERGQEGRGGDLSGSRDDHIAIDALQQCLLQGGGRWRG